MQNLHSGAPLSIARAGTGDSAEAHAGLTFAILLLLGITLLQRSSADVSVLDLVMGGFAALIIAWAGFQIMAWDRYGVTEALLLAFLGWCLATLPLALINDASPYEWLRRAMPALLLPGMAIATIVAFRTERRVRLGFSVLLVVTVAGVLRSLVNFPGELTGAALGLHDVRTFGGGFFGPVGFSLAAAVAVGGRIEKNWRFLAVLVAVLTGIATLIGLTRTYWISTVLGIIFVAAFLDPRRHRLLERFIGFGVVIATVAVLVLSAIAPVDIVAFASARFSSIFYASQTLSVLDRVAESQGIIESLRAQPSAFIVGNGFGTKFSYVSVNPFTWDTVGLVQNDYAHNYYLYLLWTAGTVGLALFVMMFTHLIFKVRSALRCLESSSFERMILLGLVCATINLLISSAAAPQLMRVSWAIFFGVAYGLAVATASIVEDKRAG